MPLGLRWRSTSASSFFKQGGKFAVQIWREPQLVESQGADSGLEDADHGLFAVNRWKGVDAQVNTILILTLENGALLRNVETIGEQLRHNLEPGDDVGRQLALERKDGLEHAVKAIADLEGMLRRLEVNVACRAFHGVGKNAVHQPAYGNRRVLGEDKSVASSSFCKAV